MKKKKVAVDFDGTVVDHRWPEIGPNAPGAVETLKALVENNWYIILFTMRHAKELQDAVEWYKKHDIPLFGINRDPEQDSWTQSPKAYAQIYIDDASFNAPLIEVPGFHRRCIDWEFVRTKLITSAKVSEKPEDGWIWHHGTK